MLKFAVAGSPSSTPPPGGTVEGLRRARELGITAMEIEWVQNVPAHKERVREIRAVAEELKMALTVHAPYYVNLNTPERAKLAASKQRVLQALEMAEVAGAVSVCVHAAFNLKMDPEGVYANVHDAVEEIMEKKTKLFPHVNLALETMGKPSQFGTLDEVLRISKEFGLYPCVDFAHIHARNQGKFNTAEEWSVLLGAYEKVLGKSPLAHMHIHYSGINYGPSGERKHLPLEESDANWKEFLAVLKKRKVGGVLVCESPDAEKDTLLLQRAYKDL
ncbi:MAG: TIM barrel protein [Candidatus Peribacteraceae bacterium]|jgi:deoxyribonuclease-4